MKKKKETTNINVRIDLGLKEEFFKYLNDNDKVLSKWLRRMIEKELKK